MRSISVANLYKLLYYMNANRDFSLFLLSSSTRRTWIEIVDKYLKDGKEESSSTRRTWIEMHRYHTRDKYGVVVLHTEDVD